MNPSRAPLDSLLATKRVEWSAMLLRHNPLLRQPLHNALQILAKRHVTPLDSFNRYSVRAITRCDCNNPHDYVVHLAARQCSCGKCNCEHFLAAWFAFSQDEIAREQQEAYAASHQTKAPRGVWRSTTEHICADGFRETATFGFGDSLRCARCDEFYSTAPAETP